MIKQEWLNNTTLLLMNKMPGYSFDEAFDLVDAFLTNTGGWVPVDAQEPLGEGVPTNSNTPEQASDSISLTYFNRTKTVTVDLDITVKISQTGSFPSGTSQANMVNALKPLIEKRFEKVFNEPLGFHYEGADWNSSSVEDRSSGILTSALRVAVQQEISTQAVLSDPAAIGTAKVRSTYALDSTWMAEKIFNKGQNYPIVVFVTKYTNTSYTTKDTTFDEDNVTKTYNGYVAYIDPVTHRVQSCALYPVSTII